MSFRNSLVNSFRSVWGAIVDHSLIHNIFEILEPGEISNLLKLSLYPSDRVYCESVDSLHSFEKEHHTVKNVKIASNGEVTYCVKTGVVTLQDKLIISFFVFPVTVLESIVYLLLAPTVFLTFLLLSTFLIISFPYYFFSSEPKIKNEQNFLFDLSANLIACTALGLIMSVYRALQAALRIPVGLCLLLEASIGWALAEGDTTLQENAILLIQDLENKTPENIRAFGIPVADKRPHELQRNSSNSLRGASVLNSQPLKVGSYEDSPLSSSQPNFDSLPIPERYQCPVTLKLMKNPVLLNDGIFYEYEVAMQLIHSDNQKSPVSRNVELIKTCFSLTTLTQEISAFKQAIQSEYDRAKKENHEPNYQSIIDIANEAAKEANLIFEKINKVPQSADENQQKFLVRIAQEVEMGTKNFAKKFQDLSKVENVASEKNGVSSTHPNNTQVPVFPPVFNPVTHNQVSSPLITDSVVPLFTSNVI